MDSLFGKVGDANTGAPNELGHRAHNWTAILDEVADLESNTRNVSAGVGGIFTQPPGADPVGINMATAGPDGGPARDLRNSSAQVCQTQSASPDWDNVSQFLLGLTAPRAPLQDSVRAAQVTSGRAVFEAGRCATCHGGSKWSSSRVPYDPRAVINGHFAAEVAHGTPYNADGGSAVNREQVTISGDDVPDDADAGVPSPRLERIACVLRNVDTYFVDGGQSALEVRQDMRPGNWAQGRRGYNPPPLTGLRYSAPYLHNGAAATLNDLLTRPAYSVHLRAGNASFAPSAAEVDNLVAFLESIDDDTPVIPAPADFNLCPQIY